MPSKKTQKKKGDEERDDLGTKLIIVLFFIALLAFAYFVVKQREGEPKKTPRPRAQVLGEQTGGPIQDAIGLQKRAEEAVVSTAQDLHDATGQVLGAVASRAASFVVENAGEGIVTQIDKLPSEQKEEIKAKICK